MKYYIIIASILVYACLWVFASELDRDYCTSKGLQYGYTSVTFKGYCRVYGGFNIPITSIWQDSNIQE